MTDKKEGLVNQKKSTKKGCFYLKGLQSLTKAETEVYYMKVNDFLNQANIANRRGCSPQAVSKLMRSLKEKGAFGVVFQPSGLVNPTTQPTQLKGKHIRLHGEHWRIEIINKSEKYYKILTKSNTIPLDGNTLVLSEDTIQIYSKTGFLGNDPDEAQKVSLEYWIPLMYRIENEFNVILVKERYQNIKRVSAHYAEINNELSKDYQDNTSKLLVKATEDGKTWLLTDNSFRLNELETIHPKTAHQDMQAIVKHFNDIRDNKPPTMSELSMMLKEVMKQNAETATGLNTLISFFVSQLPKPPKLDNFPKKSEVSYVG
jgi:DNA-binding CsgD family transcriptional regulator